MTAARNSPAALHPQLALAHSWPAFNATAAMIPLSVLLLIATVSTSHAAARMDHRLLLAFATAAHHLGTASWIGAMPFLLISLGRAEKTGQFEFG